MIATPGSTGATSATTPNTISGEAEQQEQDTFMRQFESSESYDATAGSTNRSRAWPSALDLARIGGRPRA